jgi:hypothetical protein
VAAAVVEQQAVVVAEQAADHEVGVAVGLVVEERDHVVVARHVGVVRPQVGGRVVKPAQAVADEDVLARHRAVVDRDQVDEPVAVRSIGSNS